MSFLKTLFGIGKSDAEKAPAAREEYNGFVILAEPMTIGNQFQIAGTITKVVGGETKSHHFVRADYFSAADDAAEATLRKAKQAIDQLGEGLFD